MRRYPTCDLLQELGLRSLGELGQDAYLPFIQSYLDDGGRGCRTQAVMALVNLGTPQAVKTLIGVATGDEPGPRRLALSRLGPEENKRLTATLALPGMHAQVDPLLAAAASDPELNEWQLDKILGNISDMSLRTRTALTVCQQREADGNAKLLSTALNVLAKAGPPAAATALPWLESHKDCLDEQARLAIARSIAALKPPPPAPPGTSDSDDVIFQPVP